MNRNQQYGVLRWFLKGKYSASVANKMFYDQIQLDNQLRKTDENETVPDVQTNPSSDEVLSFEDQ